MYCCFFGLIFSRSDETLSSLIYSRHLHAPLLVCVTQHLHQNALSTFTGCCKACKVTWCFWYDVLFPLPLFTELCKQSTHPPFLFLFLTPTSQVTVKSHSLGSETQHRLFINRANYDPTWISNCMGSKCQRLIMAGLSSYYLATMVTISKSCWFHHVSLWVLPYWCILCQTIFYIKPHSAKWLGCPVSLFTFQYLIFLMYKVHLAQLLKTNSIRFMKETNKSSSGLLHKLISCGYVNWFDLFSIRSRKKIYNNSIHPFFHPSLQRSESCLSMHLARCLLHPGQVTCPSQDEQIQTRKLCLTLLGTPETTFKECWARATTS